MLDSQSNLAKKALHIAHVIPYLGLAQGGPVHALSHQLKHQFDHYDISLYSSPIAQDGAQADFPETVQQHSFPTSNTLGFRYCPALKRSLHQNAAKIDILHSHMIWTDSSRNADQVGTKHAIPHIISPCGTLNQTAIHFRAYKKKLIALAFQKKALNRAACIQAKSELEMESIRAFGIKTPIALIPNIIDAPQAASVDDIAAYRQRFKLSASRKRILYLGRIHPVKGVKRLLQAWKGIHSEHTDWELVIAGPDENNYKKSLLSELNLIPEANKVTFTGMLQDTIKSAALKDASLFVLPSDFENFGNSAVEAAMTGTPIIATQGTSWKQLQASKAGWWVDTSCEGIKNALEQACQLSTSELETMGQRAEALVIQNSPEKICQKWEAVYPWLTDQAPMPDCVYTS